MVLNDLPLRSVTARSDAEPLTGVRAHTWPYHLAVTRAALAGLTFGRLTVIVGENGAGKSSLVESIAEAYGLPLGGGDNRVSRPTFDQVSAFGADLQIVRGAAGRRAGLFLRAEGMLGHLEYMASLESKQATDILRLSHGEGAQRLLEESFDDYGLWILDEPESGLSFSGQLELCARVLAVLERGGQVVLCTHSPLLAALATHCNELVWEIGEWGVRQLAWAELDMIVHWRNMLDDPEMYLHHLG